MAPQSILRVILLHALRLVGAALFGLIITALPVSTNAEDLNSYTITRTSGKITIDGKLDEASWNNAREVALVNTRNGEGGMAYILLKSQLIHGQITG